MAWITLFFAGILEIVWAVSLKKTDGFTKLWPSMLTLSAMLVSFYLLGRALRELPIGTAYAIWTGIGAAGTAIYGIAVSGEPATAARIICLALIILGTIGLKFTHG